MSEQYDDFVASMKSVRLSPDEKKEIAHSLGIRVRSDAELRLLGRTMTPTQFLKAAKKVTMSASEKAILKEGLIDAISNEPARFWLSPFKSFTSALAAFVIVILGGGSISYAAEDALPGDFLYPVKIHVNESVKSRLITSPESSARYEARRAERRLEEAEALASQAKLDAETQAQIATAFKNHASSVQAHIDTLIKVNDEDGTALAMEFEATLRAHNKVLVQLAQPTMDLAAAIDEVRMGTEETLIEVQLKKDDQQNNVFGAALKVAARNASAKIGSGESLRFAVTQAKVLSGSNLSAGIEMARKAVRKAKEAEVLGKLKLKGDASIATDTTLGDDNDDANFSVRANVRLLQKKLGILKKNAETRKEGEAPLPVESYTTGSEQLLDIATQQLNEGNASAALETSNNALIHVEEASGNYSSSSRSSSSSSSSVQTSSSSSVTAQTSSKSSSEVSSVASSQTISSTVSAGTSSEANTGLPIVDPVLDPVKDLLP